MKQNNNMYKLIILIYFSPIPLTVLSQDNYMNNRAVPFLSNEKWGWSDVYTNQTLIEPVYDSVDFDYNKGFMVYDNGKVGIADCKNRNNCSIVIPTEYDNIYQTRFGFVTTNHGKKGFVNLNNEVLVDNLFDKIYVSGEYLYLINNEDFSSGVFDRKNNKEIISPIYKIIPIEYTKFHETFKEYKEDMLIKFDIFQDAKGKYHYYSRENKLKEIITNIDLEKEGLTSKYRIIEGVEEIKKDDIIFTGNNNFKFGSRNKDEKFKIGKTKLYNTNQYFNNYLLVQDKSGDKFGIINLSTDSIILKPKYQEIKIIKTIYDYLVIAKKNEKLTLVFKDKRITEIEYDEVLYNETRDLLIVKKNKLFGFIFINRKKTFDENENIKFVAFEPKYTDYKHSKYTTGYYGISVLNVTNTENQNYYISNFGYEYKK